MEFDLVLLHPPSFYDFRKNKQFRGPISDVVPSSSIFDMYPIGFTSIAGHLERSGYRVKIVNLAARMLHNRRFDVEKKFADCTLPPSAFPCIGCPTRRVAPRSQSWLRNIIPTSRSFSAASPPSYYHRELIQHDYVDFVVRGDSTENAMLALMQEIKSGATDFSAVPNLTWKRNGQVIVNPFGTVSASLDDIDIPDYRYAMRSVFKYRSLLDALPYEGWLEYPLSALLTTRGCSQDCALWRRFALCLCLQLRPHQTLQGYRPPN